MLDEILRQITKTGYGPDLIKALRNFECRQVILRKQVHVHLGQIVGSITLKRREHITPEYTQAVIDMLHARSPNLLIVGDDLTSLKLDIARIKGALVPEHGHEPLFTAPQKRRRHRLIIAWQIRIAIEHEELVAQQMRSTADGAGSPKQRGSI